MIAVVSARTLRGLRESTREAEEMADAALAEAERSRQEAERATDSAIRAETALEELRASLARTIADAARAEGELAALRAQSFLDTEDRQALRTLLRMTRRQTQTDRVYALFRSGDLHSVHTTLDAAESAAEAEGAPRSGWTVLAPDTAPPACEVLWRVQRLPLSSQ
ncbi:hypothetical protein [Streptomyces echinatus]|uniref:Uncharacterized protein n=1 Tax=Streptomyces echinatus TaxID=67293 RepID=A0A7W9UWE0_9ACTN|nr:hypothetical protein [Streptomyces echinatus]MBB5932579.1 hypothetical protein [Streptomyces echinatus]